jgi:hypothetical protein
VELEAGVGTEELSDRGLATVVADGVGETDDEVLFDE